MFLLLGTTSSASAFFNMWFVLDIVNHSRVPIPSFYRITMQAEIVKCCRVVVGYISFYIECLIGIRAIIEFGGLCWDCSGDNTSGPAMVLFQHYVRRSLASFEIWINVWCRFVLYMIYYPAHLRYVESGVEESELQPLLRTKTHVKSTEWALSILVAWITAIHLFVFISFFQ